MQAIAWAFLDHPCIVITRIFPGLDYLLEIQCVQIFKTQKIQLILNKAKIADFALKKIPSGFTKVPTIKGTG